MQNKCARQAVGVDTCRLVWLSGCGDHPCTGGEMGGRSGGEPPRRLVSRSASISARSSRLPIDRAESGREAGGVTLHTYSKGQTVCGYQS